MFFLTWTEEYAVGHQALDAEHRRLVAIINEICSVEASCRSPQSLASRLNALTLAAVEHFKHENSVMRDFSAIAAHHQSMAAGFMHILSDAAVNDHCSEHARALLALGSIVADYCSGAELPSESVGKCLIDWFHEHAIKHDAELRIVFEGLKP